MSSPSLHTRLTSPGAAPIVFIQYLRAIAALMVVWHHAMTQLPGMERHLPYQFGTLGVDLFFVISGFIMVVTTHGKSMTAGAFMWKRIVRVAPLYWLLTLAMVGASVVVPSLFKTLIVTPAALVQSLLFIPHFSTAFPQFAYPLLVPGWSLNYEMAFYAVFALTLILRPTLRLWVLGLVIGGAVVAGKVSGPYQNALWFAYTHPIVIEFLIGALIGKAYLAGRFRFPRFKARLLGALGDASYSLYLTHIFTLGAARAVWNRLYWKDTYGAADTVLFLCLAIPLCSLVGWVCYRTVELPLGRWLNRSRPPVQALAVAGD